MAPFHSRHAPTIRIPAPLHVASSSWLAFAKAMLSGSCKHGRISWLRLTAFSILLAACLLLCSCGKAPAKEEAEQPLSIAEPIPGFDAPGPEEGEQALDITPEEVAEECAGITFYDRAMNESFNDTSKPENVKEIAEMAAGFWVDKGYMTSKELDGFFPNVK